MKKTKRAKTKHTKKKLSTKIKEKLIGKVDHVYEKIGVITTTLIAPLKVGDIVRVKGSTTNFLQEVDSMQINHKNVSKAKKGDGVGIKVKSKVRDNDNIFIASKKAAIEYKKSQDNLLIEDKKKREISILAGNQQNVYPNNIFSKPNLGIVKKPQNSSPPKFLSF